MASKQAALVPVERSARDISDSAPRRVYLGDHPTLTGYVFVDTQSEATAWLKDTGSSVFKFDDDSAEDDRKPYLVATSPSNVVVL